MRLSGFQKPQMHLHTLSYRSQMNKPYSYNAKVLWDRVSFIGQGEDRKIDAGNELKLIRMKNGKAVGDYIARRIKWKVLQSARYLENTKRKSMDEILQILREEEATFNQPIKTRMDGINVEAFYSKRKSEKQTTLCYVCRKSNPLVKDCYYRNKNSPSTSQRSNSSRNGHVFTASHREEKLCDNTWTLDSVASCHMAKESVWFKNISPEVIDSYLADKILK
ncbi:retrovirus-related Pol polyprotein from transposon TNT 1-94 [Trichonephila clavipes]|nr:retrovirus-related Pol polyprotein from transposon TNT 1-94 [Trichonephila clavipes]